MRRRIDEGRLARTHLAAAPRPRGRLLSLALCLIASLPLLVSSAGCGFYSLTGATIPPHLQTIAIPLVEDRTLGAPPGLDQRLTDLLVERFAGRTRLVLVQDETDADAVLLATIERYANEPAAVTGQQVAALNRVSLSVRVTYVDRVQDRERLARSFQGREEYAATAVEQEAATALLALEQIAEDVFTAATSDW